MSAAQDRRPGLRAMADAIARRNPTWSHEACASIAKMQWTMNQHTKLKALITTAREGGAL